VIRSIIGGMAVAHILAAMAFCAAAAAEIDSTSQFMPADSAHFLYTGRVAKEGSQVRWEWPGVKVGVGLNCPPAGVKLQVHIDVPTWRPSPLVPLSPSQERSRYTVLVNGTEVASINTDFGTSAYSISLPAAASGERFIEIFKKVERMSIVVSTIWLDPVRPQPATIFNGITIPEACSPVPPPQRPTRRLEFIGDSITCGFGNLAHTLADKAMCNVENKWPAFENFGLSFANLCAEAFKAEHHTQCISGIGVTRNAATLEQTTPYNFSHYVHRTLSSLPDPEWNYTS